MKKPLTIFLSVLMGLSCLAGLSGCKPNKDFDPNSDLDTKNIFFDDFDDGLDPEHWFLMNSKWGPELNGGVIPENIAYTADGEMIIFSNGNNYDGEKRGHGKDHGRQTGGGISTRDAFGPGRFEVRMKCVPRFGPGTAVWTFYYEGREAGQEDYNHEIDIELNVKNDFSYIWNTNFSTVKQTVHTELQTPVVNNDGEFHTYKFEWHTNPQRIDYYVDDIHTYTSTAYVPYFAGGFQIGNWFPNWAGQADFETDFMLVDWFRYTPYKNNPYTETPTRGASPDAMYPTAPIEKPISNLFSAGDFEKNNVARSWNFPTKPNPNIELGNESGVSGSKGLTVKNNAKIEQWISGTHKGFTYRFTAAAKALGTGGGIRIDTIKDYDTIVETFDFPFTETDFDLQDHEFTLSKDAWRMTVTLYSNDGGEITFDDLFMNLSKLYTK